MSQGIHDNTALQLEAIIERYEARLLAVGKSFPITVESLRHRGLQFDELATAVVAGEVGVLAHLDGDDLNLVVKNLSADEMTGLNTTLAAWDLAGRLEFANNVLPRLSSENVRRLGQGMSVLQPAMTVPGHDATGYAWVDGELDVTGIRARDVNQGKVGNCWFLVTLKNQALTEPEFYEEVFVDNGNGTYTVTFFRDDEPTKVTVDGSLPVDANGELVFAQEGEGSGNFFPVYEKAFAMFKGGDYMDMHGGKVKTSIEEVVGEEGIVKWSGNTWNGSLPGLNYMARAIANGQPVAIATDEVFNDPNLTTELVAKHAYSVVAVDLATGEITLRNTHGVDEPPYELTISKDEYHRLVNSVYTNK